MPGPGGHVIYQQPGTYVSPGAALGGALGSGVGSYLQNRKRREREQDLITYQTYMSSSSEDREQMDRDPKVRAAMQRLGVPQVAATRGPEVGLEPLPTYPKPPSKPFDINEWLASIVQQMPPEEQREIAKKKLTGGGLDEMMKIGLMHQLGLETFFTQQEAKEESKKKELSRKEYDDAINDVSATIERGAKAGRPEAQTYLSQKTAGLTTLGAETGEPLTMTYGQANQIATLFSNRGVKVHIEESGRASGFGPLTKKGYRVEIIPYEDIQAYKEEYKRDKNAAKVMWEEAYGDTPPPTVF